MPPNENELQNVHNTVIHFSKEFNKILTKFGEDNPQLSELEFTTAVASFYTISLFKYTLEIVNNEKDFRRIMQNCVDDFLMTKPTFGENTK